MASQISAIFHGWKSKFYSLMSVVEEIQTGSPCRPEMFEALAEEARNLAQLTSAIAPTLGESERSSLAESSLAAAEGLRLAIEAAKLSADHSLRDVYEEFSDSAELLTLSVDPEVAAEIQAAKIAPATTLEEIL